MRLTNEEFINRIKNNHPKLYEEIDILEEFNTIYHRIHVMTKYGKCNPKASSLLKGDFPSVLSAINKTEYYINKCIEKHGDKYDYSKCVYSEASNDVVIICKEHGEFPVRAGAHLYQNCGCKLCANKNQCGDGFYRQKLMNKNEEKWKNEIGILYVLECYNYREKFYKIGITKQSSIKDRFNGSNKLPYNFTILLNKQIILYDAIIIEKELHQIHSDFKYIPNIKFGGYTECFYSIDLNKIKEVISAWNQQ